MKKEYTDTTNTVENGSWTLRGNASTFSHMYEYARIHNRPPQHHLNMKFGRTDADMMYAAFLEEVGKVWPNAIQSPRHVHDVSMHDVPDDIRKVTDMGEIFTVSETGVSVYSYRSGNNHLGVEIFVGNDDEYERMRDIITATTAHYKRVDEPFKDKFYMISHDGNSLVLREYTVNKEKFAGFDIDLLYNDDFKSKAETIETALAEKNGTGIVLLHGVVGSAKTTYLRHLISTLKKRVIYMAPDMASQLSSPSFFNFIRGYPNSILIIEDAEDVLRKRGENGSSTAVSNILNTTDGIMGDALNIQVVCTFNADLNDIDEAIRRPGRLIARYFFDYLTKEKTLALVKHVHGEDAEPTREKMTVGEVYNMKEENDSPPPRKSNGIGFTAGVLR